MSDYEGLIRPEVAGLRPYSPGKPIEEVEREFGLKDIIKLASNENPLGPSPAALAAMQEAVTQTRLYPDNECYHLRRALARHLEMPEDTLIVGRGSDEVIHMLGLAFVRPGEEVMMCQPPFTLYEFTAQLMGAVQVRVPQRDFRHDLPAMIGRLSERTKLVFLSNPNNPTGAMITRSEVAAMLAALPPQAILVLDEAYYEYVDDPEFPTSLDYVREGKRVVVLRTFSKIYALAGLRIGYGIAPADMMRFLHQVREPFNVSSVAQAAAVASLGDPDQVVRSRELNRHGLRYLCREFERLGLPYVPSQANFVYVDTKVPCRPLFIELLKRGVIVRTGDIFGHPTHIRVTTGTREENQRFITALEEALPIAAESA